MKRTRIAMMIPCLVLAGCVSQQADDSTFKSSTTVSESQDRNRARVHTELAAGYYGIGNIGVALEEVNEALRADPNYGPAHNIAGVVYAQLKEDRQAEQSFQRAISINQSDYDANNNYGEFLCQRKREEEAIRYFMAAVRNPLYATPERSYVNAGVCARRRGDDAGAEGYFQMALKTRPSQPQALYQLADLSYVRGDLGAAKAYLSRLAQVGADTPEVLWLGVRVVRKMGDRNAEASYARQLRNKFPNSAEVRALNAGQYE